MAQCGKRCNVEVHSAREQQRSVVSSRLEEAIILARRSQSEASIQATNHVSIIDRIFSELRRRFDESREIVFAVAACSLRSKHLLKVATVKPLAD